MSMVPMTQEQMDLEVNWKMPAIEVGAPVCWYAKWNVPSEPSLGFVLRVSIRSVEALVFTPTGSERIANILHKDDPRLRTNPNMQINGSWDYSAFEKRLQAVEAASKPVEVAVEEAPAVSVADKPTKAPKEPKVKKKREWTQEQREAQGKRLAAARERAAIERERRMSEINGALAE